MSFDGWQEQEAFIEQYGEPYTAVLGELLALIRDVESHSLSGYDARIKAKVRFKELMHQNVPACHAKVKAYQAKIAEIAARDAAAGAAYYERQNKLRIVEEQRQRELAEAHDRSQREAHQRQQQQLHEAREKLAEQERQQQKERDRQLQEQSAAMERQVAQADTK